MWTASGAIANVNTLLAGVSFVPALNFNANFTIATSVSDGALSVTGSKAMTGTAVNDAPTATNLSAAETYVEDTTLNLVNIVASDVDSATVTATLTLSNTGAGSLTTGTSGAVTSTYVPGTGVWTASGAIADVNTLLAGVSFVPALNFNANFTIATSVSDGALSVTGSKAMTGTAVNDAPTATNLSAAETYVEDTTLNLVNIVASDVDSATVTATLTLSNTGAGSLTTGTSGAVTSTYVPGTGVWTASGAIADVNTLLAGVSFVPALNFNANFTIATSVSDGALSVTGSKAMTGTAVNDAPELNAAGTPTFTAVAEDSTNPAGDSVLDLIASGGAGYITDVDAGALQGIAVTGSDETNGTWQYSTNNGTTWLALGAVSPGSARLLESSATTKLRFVPNADFNGTATITLRAWDQTFGANGALTGTTVNGGTTAFSVATDSASLTVTAVNDAPVAVNGSVTTDEDTDHVFGASDFNFTDPNDSPPNGFAAVVITSLPTAGTLRYDGSAVVAGDLPLTVSAADLLAGKLVFRPAANANGTPYATFGFRIQDNGGTLNGGDDTSDNVATETVNVTEVNDAPLAVNGSVTTDEDTDHVFGASDFDFTDPNDSPPNGFAAVVITSLPTAGTLRYDGSAVVAGDLPLTVSAADLLAGKLVFRPAANANGTPYATFGFRIQDNGGTLNGGDDTSDNVATETVNVTEVNDAPTAVADSTTGRGRLGHLRPAHQRLDGSCQRVRPDADHHRRHPGRRTARVTFTAASAVTYTPAANYNGPDSFSYTDHRQRHDQRRQRLQVRHRPRSTSPSPRSTTRRRRSPTRRPGRGRLGHLRPAHQRLEGSCQRVRPDAHHHRGHPGRRTAAVTFTAGTRDLHPGRQLQRPRQLHLHHHRQRHDQRRQRLQVRHRPRSTSPSPRSTTRRRRSTTRRPWPRTARSPSTRAPTTRRVPPTSPARR